MKDKELKFMEQEREYSRRHPHPVKSSEMILKMRADRKKAARRKEAFEFLLVAILFAIVITAFVGGMALFVTVGKAI